MKPFALDIYEAKKVQTGEWQRDFFWPVTDQEFFNIVDAVADIFVQELESADQTCRDILLASAGHATRCASFLHALLVIDRLISKGYEVRSDQQSEFFWDILNRRSPGIAGISQGNRRIYDEFRRKTKDFAKFLLLNRFTPHRISRSLKAREYVISLGTFSRLKREYCENEGIVFHRSINDYLSVNGERSHEGVPFVEEFTHRLVNGLNRIAEGFNLALNDFSKSYLENLTRDQFVSSHFLYHHILNGRVRKTRRVLLAEVGKVANRTICFALKQRFGSEIVGFEHGNTFGSLISKYFSVRELAHCDKYVVSTSGSIPNFRVNQKASKYPCGMETEIVSMDSDYYLSLWNRNRKTTLPRRIQSVMIIGFPMDPYRYPELPGHYSLFHLDLELRLMRFLESKGLHVIYKVHPDRAAEAEGIFEGLADEICVEPFERVSDKGDATLFTHTDTSTFGVALCGLKPIIVVEMEGKTWNQESLRLIEKRCRIVPGRLDERNRILFDEIRLEEALAEEITSPDTEFLEQFMFPRGQG